MNKELLDTKRVSRKYKLGRDLTRHLLERLPHIVVGVRGTGVQRLVREDTIDLLIAKAECENVDLWKVVKECHPTALCRWLELPVPPRLLEASRDDSRPMTINRVVEATIVPLHARITSGAINE